MTITVSQIASLVSRYTNEVVVGQANLECEVVSSGTIEKLMRPTKLGVVNIKAGGLAATAAIADGGSLPAGDDVQPIQLTYQPKGIFTRIAIPRMGAELASSTDDGIDIVFQQMESAGRDLGRNLGRMLFDGSLGSPDATGLPTLDTDTTFQVVDVSGFRRGMTVSRYNSGGTFQEAFQVQDVAVGLDGANSTITTTAAIQGTGWAASDVLWMGPEGAKDQLINSLADVCADSTLYGQSQSNYEWSGNLSSSVGALTNAKIKNLATKIARRRGKKFSHLVCNSLNEQRIYEDHVAEIRYTSGKMDEYGLKLAFDGRPVVVDENCGDSDVYLLQKDDVKVHCFREFAPDIDGSKKAGMNRGSVLVSDSKLIYDVQIWGAYNLRVERRNGTGRLTGITS